MLITAATDPRTRALTQPAHEAVKEVFPVENINTMAMTNPVQGDVTAFAMPVLGTSVAGMTSFTTVCTSGVQQSIDTTGLFIETTTVDRARTKVAAKGHVALAAYVPGIHAWSPPLC